MKLVLQRTAGDCGIAALATWLEQSYEDVYVAGAKVDRKTRGRNGIALTVLVKIGQVLGVRLRRKREPVALDDDEGLLVVNWAAPHKRLFDAHLVVLAHGVIADPADGLVLPADEYLARERAVPGSLLVEA
jgi:ABC-type bacteriocin/lantibiotic exporter with double-glycine peptidase domain